MFLKIGHLQNPMDYHHVQYWPIFSHRNNLKNIRDHTRGSIPHFQTRQSFGRWNQDGGSIGSHPPWNKAKVSLWNLGPGFVESVISDFPSGKPTTWGISREYELCFILLGPTFRKSKCLWWKDCSTNLDDLVDVFRWMVYSIWCHLGGTPAFSNIRGSA